MDLNMFLSTRNDLKSFLLEKYSEDLTENILNDIASFILQNEILEDIPF